MENGVLLQMWSTPCCNLRAEWKIKDEKQAL
jgi:hypothetical protein